MILPLTPTCGVRRNEQRLWFPGGLWLHHLGSYLDVIGS